MPRPGLMLAMATLGFGVNFWAWALLSPLGPRFKDTLGLSSFQQVLLVAVPVVVGALGRIPVGALTDRYGGRVMFSLVLGGHDRAGAVPGDCRHSSLTALLVGGSLFAIWPFTRLVHVMTAPVGYLTRPYVVCRSHDTTITVRTRRGWEG